MPSTTTSVKSACVTVMTFVATVHVTADPSERFSSAAPAIEDRSPSVIVLPVLTVASKSMTRFVTAGVTMVSLFERTVSGLSTIFSFHSFLLFCQDLSGACEPDEAVTSRRVVGLVTLPTFPLVCENSVRRPPIIETSTA